MRIQRIYHSLRFKVTLGILLPLLIILAILFYRQYTGYQELLLENLQLAATNAGEIIEGSLLYAMLTNDFSTVQQILDNIAEQQGVHGLFVLDKEGQVVLSAGSEALGGKVDLEDATCQVCHDREEARWNGSLVLAAEGDPRTEEIELFRNVNAIENKEGCQTCHDPQSSITGVLIADFPMASIRAQLAVWRRRSLLWTAVSVLLVAGAIDLLMSRMIVSRLERFVRIVKRVGTGDLDARVTSGNSDEIGQLAYSFNRMADGLREKDFLEQDLKERTNQLQVQAEKLSTLNTIAGTVSQSLNLQEILDGALAKVLELMRLRAGWIVLTGEQSQELDLAASYGLPHEVALEHVRCAGDQCICPDVLQSGQSKVLDGTSGPSADAQCPTAQYFAGEGLVFQACVPLQAKDRILGVMSLAGDTPRDVHMPAEDTVDTLAAIGRQIGIAIENATLYEELRKEEMLRRQLLDRLITVQEEERKRIALELHDQTGQPLTSLIMTLGMLGEAESMSGVEVRAQAQHLRETAAQVMKEVHDLALELRPSMLDDLGLLAALRHLHKGYQDRFHIPVDLQVLGLSDERLPSEVETAFYRIVQEALTNVAKHAQAETVSVVLEKRGASVRLIIEDDGQGFDVTSVLGSRGPGSVRGEYKPMDGRLGLYGMRERAALLGGTLTIESTPGMGTTIFVDVPLGKKAIREPMSRLGRQSSDV